MIRFKLLPIFLISFCTAAIAQAPILVASDVAASHLVSSVEPVYPMAAQEARIQGNVILQIEVDPSGKVSNVRIVRGHPMLTAAAIASVGGWKYTPFSSNRQPVTVTTWVSVRFGNPTNHDVEDRAEMAFLSHYWPAIAQARNALSKSEFPEAEKALNDAKASLSVSSGPLTHSFEHWRWAMLAGELSQKQKHYPDAEQQYVEALTIEKDHKDSAEAADSLNALGALYFEMNKMDLSRENLTKAVTVYRKNYKSASKNPTLLDSYGTAIANDSWLLSKIAMSDQKPEEAARQCRIVLDFRKSIGENDPKVRECEQSLAAPNTTPK
jgi:TonB family protein